MKSGRNAVQFTATMNSIASIALSGMTTAQTAMSASAFGIARRGVDGLRRPPDVPTGGSARSAEPAAASPDDMTSDVVGLLQAKNAFLANLAVFKTSDRMTGALLDALA